MIPPTVVTIVLAAGSSVRLGTHKALLRLGGKTAIARVVEASLTSNSNETIVVLGAEAKSLAREIGDLPVLLVENTQFSLGRTGSLKCALRFLIDHLNGNKTAIAAPAGSTTTLAALGSHSNGLQRAGVLSHVAIIIFPADCPLVPSPVLNKLIKCFFSRLPAGSESLWIAPEYAGKRGHPVLLFGPILSKLLELSDDFPLRDFLHSIECAGALHHLTVTVDTESVLDNINTSDDLARVLRREGLT